MGNDDGDGFVMVGRYGEGFVMCFTCTHAQKAADTLMCVYKAGVLPDHCAQLCLESCITQGLPAAVHVVQVS